MISDAGGGAETGMSLTMALLSIYTESTSLLPLKYRVYSKILWSDYIDLMKPRNIRLLLTHHS